MLLALQLFCLMFQQCYCHVLSRRISQVLPLRCLHSCCREEIGTSSLQCHLSLLCCFCYCSPWQQTMEYYCCSNWGFQLDIPVSPTEGCQCGGCTIVFQLCLCFLFHKSNFCPLIEVDRDLDDCHMDSSRRCCRCCFLNNQLQRSKCASVYQVYHVSPTDLTHRHYSGPDQHTWNCGKHV